MTVAANSPGAGTPTGAITWTNLFGCTTSTLSGGSASCTTSTEPAGTNSITAAYSGDTNDSASTSTSYTQTVEDATAATVVTSGTNPSVYGQSVTFTATISGQYGLVKKVKLGAYSNAVSGTVAWSANTGCGTTPVTVNPGAPSTASCITSTLPQGTDIITATYSGDSNHSGGTGTLSGGQIVNLALTTIDVTSVSPASEMFGQDAPATITAVLAWSVGGATPTGAVTIGGTATGGTYSATSCGAASGNSITCTATFTPGTSTAAGTYTMSASIAADSNYSCLLYTSRCV